MLQYIIRSPFHHSTVLMRWAHRARFKMIHDRLVVAIRHLPQPFVRLIRNNLHQETVVLVPLLDILDSTLVKAEQ